MYIKSFCFVILLFIFFGAIAQTDSLFTTDTFSIAIPAEKVVNGKYKSFDFLDNRKEGIEDLGYIAKDEGLTTDDKLYFIKTPNPLSIQFKELFDSLNASPIDSGKLLLQLSRFKFTSLNMENFNRSFLFRANLYSVTEKGYCRIDHIDTIVKLKEIELFGGNVYKRLERAYKRANKAIVDFISRNLTNSGNSNGQYFSRSEVINIDSIEKKDIALYSYDTLVDGVYTSFLSLKHQFPEYTDFDAKFKKGRLVKVEKKSYSADDNMDYFIPDVYAVVKDEKIYININNTYSLLEKKDNDFFFTGKLNLETDHTARLVMWLFVTQLAAFFPGEKSNIKYDFKLDHVNGACIPIRSSNEKK
ncbi:hypothetical protein ACQ33O_01230 [Ferruginibacter sp. SUN002]|uniref:hypothetical protein n=1 Tax=Ferruginibacter sp. SUN002 TaxID=2937789 RepID=UPI003D36AF90